MIHRRAKTEMKPATSRPFIPFMMAVLRALRYFICQVPYISAARMWLRFNVHFAVKVG